MSPINMHYKILEAKTTPQLETKVRNYLALGWEPQGGICFDRIGYAYQAMVRRYSSIADEVKSDS